VPLLAGAAGDRPEGVADDVAGHGGGGSMGPTDRAHAPVAPLSEAGLTFHARFVEAIDDDLDLPSALAVIREILRADLPVDERRWLVLDADAVLGLGLHTVWTDGTVTARAGEPIPADIEALLAARTEARSARDFARADALRTEIEAAGWAVTDSPTGSIVSRAVPAGPGATRTGR
jgi:cysteinyl-tRNA synthetase